MASRVRQQLTERVFSHALLVCGPSGAGKSTFIDTLINGGLGPDLEAHLPAEAKHWPTFLENDIRKERVVLRPIHQDDGTGVIFHYDTFFAHRTGLADYSRDPISPYLADADQLTIVNIRPTPEQLKLQYDKRLKHQSKELGLIRSIWKLNCVKTIKRIRYRMLGKGWPYTRDLYDRPGTIEECYRSWESFLKELLSARAKTRLLDVEPTADDRASQDFKLRSLRTSPTSAR
jgi:hypothetical protein